MPEQTEGQQVDSSAQQGENQPAGGSRMYTKDELNAAVDQAVKTRIDKQSSKHSREVAAKDEEISSLSKQVTDLTTRLDAQEAEKARAALIQAIAQETGADADLLTRMAGDDEETIRLNADLLKEKAAAIPKNPTVFDAGAGSAPTLTAEQIRGIKDPIERVRARAANKGLYQ